ncbi:MAG: DNA polymerase I [Veillonellaceae bacterium]|nr:DNA polymerase I [Veillonellaceae bacterium]
MSRLVLIDGNSLLYRAFFALPPLSNAQGVPTNAVYGFLLMLVKVFEDLRPEYVAVAFDKGRTTFRNKVFAEYKGHRPDAPEDLVPQFALIREVLQTLGIAAYELEGYEGDDLIGTLAKRWENECEVGIVTGDRDTLQLVSPRTTVYLTKKGATNIVALTPAAVREEYGITPAQVVDMKALMGDSSDNIPGVPGVGEKTAVKLLQQFGTLDNLYASLAEVAGKKLPERLQENRETAYMSQELAKIDTAVPFASSLEEMRPQANPAEVAALCDGLGFKSMFGRLEKAGIVPTAGTLDFGAENEAPVAAATAWTVHEDADPAVLLRAESVAVAYAAEGEIPQRRLLRLTALVEEDAYLFTEAAATKALEYLLAGETEIITENAKDLYLLADSEPSMADMRDVTVAAYLLDPTRTSYPLSYLAEKYGVTLPANGEDPADPARADVLRTVWPAMAADLEANGAARLYYDTEMPLTQVLAAMERAGIAVCRDRLGEIRTELTARAVEIEAAIYAAAGEEFNILSPKQLGTVLFEKMQLPPGKKTKTGYSTDAEVLQALAGEHPIAADTLAYRTVTKLISTYLDGIEQLISPETERVHSHFNQTVTATGRLSSSDPNLQNIPVRTAEGRRIRSLFVPGEGYDGFTSADYSQIELRILAHFSGDEGLREAFRNKEDIHRRTAAEVLHKDPAEVTAEERSHAKAVNFGIIYGISDYGLARDLGISRAEADDYIAKYLARYPKVREFMEQMIAQAKETGRAETMFGRFRVLPDIRSRNFNRRSFAERTALNTPIQGTAADIIKRAMNRVYWVLLQEKLQSRLLLQVHDELVVETVEAERAQVEDILRRCMENAAELAVPLVVDVHYGTDWEQAK